jgi:5-methylcytosine-specific restriction protein B
MATYLLSWNPKNYNNGGEGSTKGQLIYKVGEKLEWSCHSKQVKQGDFVYLIKLGDGARGIIAKGIVTKSSYTDVCWKDKNKQRSYIEFELQDLRNTCEQGLVPFVLLQHACPEQQWSTQSSGIKIREQYQSTLDDFWQQGENHHCLWLFAEWIKQHRFNPNGWSKDYQETCKLKQKIRTSQSVNDEDLNKIWKKQANGIASVGNGFMYNKDFSENKAFLLQATLDIVNSPTKDMYDDIFNRWSSNDKLERNLYSVIHRVFAMADPEHITSIVGRNYLKALLKGLSIQFEFPIQKTDHWFQDNTALLNTVSQYINSDYDCYIRNILLWEMADLFSQKENPQINDGVTETNSDYNIPLSNQEGMETMQKMSLNQILYGPPGTGKTYRTVQMAVDAAEPHFKPKGDNISDIRRSYKVKYDDLVKDGRIRFVTFHQSYGYEEFVEGLSAKTEGDQLSYFEKDGVFKKICDDAKQGISHEEDPIEIAILKFKEALEESNRLELKTVTGKCFTVEYHGNTTFRVFPIGTVQEDLGRGYPVSIENIKKVYRGISGKEIYNSSYVKSILSFIKGEYNLSDFEVVKPAKLPNFVLIIDEINRGNISKVFGELITLIEPSKRLGQAESLEAILPYSGDTFSVPDNLYIIGTMNTADRSLALMDTALRRRFDFIEMMPDYTVLQDDQGADYCIKAHDISINLALLLKTLNQRIDALYDREHTLGHAFLIPVVEIIKTGDQDAALVELAKCFKNKIIPLLAEYFFEDWQKIRLVLGDNQKEQLKQSCLIEKIKNNFTQLFGDTEDLTLVDDEEHEYRLAQPDADLWRKPLTYVAMYDLTQLSE